MGPRTFYPHPLLVSVSWELPGEGESLPFVDVATVRFDWTIGSVSIQTG